MSLLPDIRCPLREHALHNGDATAVRGRTCDVSFVQLDAYVNRLVQQLEQCGVLECTVVGMAMEASLESIAYLFALMRLRAVALCLNLHNPPALAGKQLQALQARTLIATDTTLYTGLAPIEVWPALSFDASCSTAPLKQDGPLACVLKFHQPATIVFTSGSSGSPKAAVHSVGNHLMAAQASNVHNGLEGGDTWLLSLPVYHVAGLGIIFRCMIAGATIVLSEGEKELHVTLAQHSVSHLSVVPTQLERLLDALGNAPPRVPLKSILVGGMACDEGLMQRARDAGLPVFRTYGMTEMSSQIASVAPGYESPAAASGRVLPGVDIRISAIGEIEARGAALFLGYHVGDDLKRPLTEDGWFRTGDLGTLSRAGDLWVTGRIDNMFISGGENIQPEEIEQALCSLPGVRQALVVPIEDKTYGQRPVAFVKTDRDIAPADAWGAALDARLPRFKHPVRYLPWPERESGVEVKFDRRAFSAMASEGE